MSTEVATTNASGGGEAFLPQWLRALTWLRTATDEPAARFTDLTLDPEMLQPASNTVGAWIRVSYFLAAAVRVAVYQRQAALRAGNVSAALPSARLERLQVSATYALYAAATAAGINATYYTTGWVADMVIRVAGTAETQLRSSDVSAIRAVYTQGIAMADRAKSTRAAKELQKLAAQQPRDDRTGTDLLLDPDGDGKRNTGLIVLGVLVAVGVVAAVTAPHVSFANNLLSKR